LPYTLWLNRSKVKSEPDGLNWDGHQKAWTAQLTGASKDQTEVIRVAYKESRDRIAGFEAKAVGVLTAMAIVAAVAVLACTGPWEAKLFGVLSILFLTSGGMACCWVLMPRQRFVLALQEALSSTSGIAEMAASARMSEPVSIRVSNLVTSAIHDLVRALALTLIAVIFFVSIGSSSTPVAPQIHIGHHPSFNHDRYWTWRQSGY
jgi:hypothetical protein